MGREIFVNFLKKTISKVKAFDIVQKSIEESEDGIMILPGYMPWQQAVLESHNPKARKIMFSVFKSEHGGYSIHCVPVKGHNNDEMRKLMPSRWAGLNGKALIEASGVEDARFCSQRRNKASAKTLEGAIALAKEAVKNREGGTF